MKLTKYLLIVLMLPALIGLSGCATGQTKKILWGMVGGAAVGAVVGSQFVHHGEYRQYKSENTALTSVIFALGTGAVLNWHYNALQEREVEISGLYARTRLCDPQQLDPQLVQQLSGSNNTQAIPLQKEQIGKFAIGLDDDTKWAYPSFQKRYLQPDRGENQVISSRYIWEIVRPGQFVTRSQNPEYFVEPLPELKKPDSTASPKNEEESKQ